MFSKFAIITLLVTVAKCSASGGESSFSYGVSDPNTGDVKDQHEKRIGDTVVGQYSLLEADGTKRIVEYSSNPQTGFKATVQKDPAHGINPSAGIGYNNVAPITSALGYAGANPLKQGSSNAWNPAINPTFSGHANDVVGANRYGLNNGWNQNNDLNGEYAGINNGWQQTGINAGFGGLANEWPGSNGFNALSSGWNNAATGAYSSNGWPQNYAGPGSAYGSYKPTNPNASGYDVHGAPATSYSSRNIGW